MLYNILLVLLYIPWGVRRKRPSTDDVGGAPVDEDESGSSDDDDVTRNRPDRDDGVAVSVSPATPISVSVTSVPPNELNEIIEIFKYK